MLALVLWPLWNQLKGPLQSVLKEKFSLLGGHFKALLASTIDDLVASLQKEFFDTDVWRHLADRSVREKRGDRKKYEFTAFPPSAIENASTIRLDLIKRLRSNVRLDAARTDAKVSDSEWDELLDTYAGNILRLGLSFALKRMIENGAPLYLQQHVIAIAEKEPIRINKVAGHHDLVILYSKSSMKGAPTLGDASKIWKKRTDNSYDYNLGDYDGFIAK